MHADFSVYIAILFQWAWVHMSKWILSKNVSKAVLSHTVPGLKLPEPWPRWLLWQTGWERHSHLEHSPGWLSTYISLEQRFTNVLAIHIQCGRLLAEVCLEIELDKCLKNRVKQTVQVNVLSDESCSFFPWPVLYDHTSLSVQYTCC